MVVVGYNIYKAGVKVNAELITDLSLAFTGQDSNTIFDDFTIRSVNDGGLESSPQSLVSFVTKPGKVIGLSITVDNDTQLSLDWDAVTGDGTVTYNVLRGTTTGNLSIIESGVTSNSYIDNNGLIDGTEYFYRVFAVNSTGDGEISDIASGTPSNAELKDLTLSVNTITFDTDEIEASPSLNGYSALHTPRSVYYQGKTFFVITSSVDDPYDMESWVIMYDENEGVLTPIPFDRPSNNDTHLQFSLAVDSNTGTLYLYREQVHNGAVKVYRSVYNDDISAFEDTELVAGNHAYVGINQKQDGNFVMWLRDGGPNYNQIMKTASNAGTDWSSSTIIARGSNVNDRQYPTTIQRFFVDGKYYFHTTSRYLTGAGNIEWRRFALFETEDFDTFTGVGSGQSVTISIDGPISFSDFTNFCYRVLPEGRNGRQACVDVSPTGKAIRLGSDGLGGFECSVWDGVLWQNKPVNIPNIRDYQDIGGSSQISPFVQVQFRRDNYIVVFVHINNLGASELHQYKSVDLGDTWEFVQVAFQGVGSSLYRLVLPYNYYEIPNNSNFAVLAFESAGDLETSDQNTLQKVFLKEASFGDIQTKVSSGVSGYGTDLSELGWNRLYYIEPGKVTESSSGILSSLIDQSGNNNNAVALGSPVWNSIDMATLDGINDLFQIPTTGILGTNKLCVVQVVQVDASSGGATFSISNSNSDSQYLLSQLINLSTDNVQPRTFVTIPAQNQIIGANSINRQGLKTVLIHVWDGISAPKTYINGKLHSRVLINVGPDRFQVNKCIQDLPNLNNCSWGGLVRTTTTYSAIEAFMLGVTTTVPSFEQIQRISKTLCDKYGIIFESSWRV